MKITNPISWWRGRHYRRLRNSLRFVDVNTQLGVAQGIIANMAVQLPRSKRRGFLVTQGDKISELTMQAVQRKGMDKLELL